MIAVIIPYFQRQEGILRRALHSICAQEDCGHPLRVIIVDDESPVPAEQEVSSANIPDDIGIEILHQRNAGPGAARNTGLDAVQGVEYVAFLDSDDEWSPDHLFRAVAALDQGFDFYFANLYQLDQKIGAFERAGRISPDQHPLLPGSASGLHAYVGDMFAQITFGNVIGTPTVMYRARSFPNLRFLPDFRSAGEDYLFWIALAQAGARISFSEKVEAFCGRGVNVYSGVVWGTAEHLQRIHEEMRYRRYIMTNYSLSAEQTKRIVTQIEKHRIEFGQSLLSLLLHRRTLPLSLLRLHFRADPRTFFEGIPRAVLERVLPKK